MPPAAFLVLLFVCLAGAVIFRDAGLRLVTLRRSRRLLENHQAEAAAKLLERYLATPTWLFNRRKLHARFSLAHCYYRLERPADALAQIDAVIEAAAEPQTRALAYQMRADCLERLGRVDEAAEARREALAAWPQDTPRPAVVRLIEVDRREAEGDYLGALALLAELGDDCRDSGDQVLVLLRLRQARLQLRLGDAEAARATLEALLARPALPRELEHDVHAVSARTYLDLERFDQAERDAQTAFRIANLALDREKLIDDCALLAELSLHRGDYVAAMKNLQRVRECGGRGRWIAGLAEGELLSLWGRPAEAAKAFQRAREYLAEAAPPQATERLLVDLVEALHSRRDDPARAAALLLPYEGVVLPDPRLALRRAAVCATVYALAGRPAEAAPHLDRLAALLPVFAHDRHLLSELDLLEAERAMAGADWSGAAAVLRRALGRPPLGISVPTVRLRLAEVLRRLGEPDAALAELRHAAGFPFPLAAVSAAREQLADRG